MPRISQSKRCIWKKMFSPAACFFLLFFFLFHAVDGHAEVFSGVSIADSLLSKEVVEQVASNPLLKYRDSGSMLFMNGVWRSVDSDNDDFLFGIALLLLLGFIRQVNPAYVRNMFRAFRNPTLSSRQLKGQLQQNHLSGLLLDLFFCCSAAVFLYQVMRYTRLDKWITEYSSLTVIIGLGLGIGIIYTIRFLLLKFGGWVFHIPGVVDHYAFNILLFNRILGILLLPFTIILSFGTGGWVQVAFIMALMVVLLFYIFRFIRSRRVFKYFLQFSVFHFILYLCAAEVLPLALLIKLIGTRLI